MKLIPLSKKGKKNAGKYFAQVDDADYDWLNKWNWTFDGNYARRCYGKFGNRKHISMHRQILGITDPSIQIDHRDRNKLNYQRDNLRVATQSQNMYNKTSHGASKFVGVSFEGDRNKWRASIKFDGIRIRKRFDTESEAAIWRNEMALKHHGEFANINQL